MTLEAIKQAITGLPEKKASTRELVITHLPYIVVYRLFENIVEVLRILHSAQR